MIFTGGTAAAEAATFLLCLFTGEGCGVHPSPITENCPGKLPPGNVTTAGEKKRKKREGEIEKGKKRTGREVSGIDEVI